MSKSMWEDAELDALSNRLFRTFARCEYALKASRFNFGDGDAKANWRQFAEEPAVRNTFDHPSTPELTAAIDYMLAHPPQKQVVKDGVLHWHAAVPVTDFRADLVLIYVRRVRNNLFHGGKFNGHWFEPQRSAELLLASMAILEASICSFPETRDAYHS